MSNNQTVDLEILLPVHNEAGTIEATIREIHAALSQRLRVRFIVCEDGSRDDTKGVLTRLAGELPLRLILSDQRKGYSRAVRDGMQALDAPYLLCLDSDGQCDPGDFWAFWDSRSKADVLIGWRTSRVDTPLRRACSRFFFCLYQAFFHVPIHDPSCPFVLARSEVIGSLASQLGAMQQGFWWEFVARVCRRGYSIRELPIRHRARAGGTTQVYKLRKMPGIFLHHFLALFKVWGETRRCQA